MNRVQILAETPTGYVLRFDHPGGQVPLLDAIECSDSYAVSFVEAGRFCLFEKGQEICFEPGDVLLSYPGRMRRFGHSNECGEDICLSIHFSPELAEQHAEDVSGKVKLLASGRTMFLAWRIRRALACEESLAIESALLDTLSALMPEAQLWKALPCREEQFLFYAPRVAKAREHLDGSFDQNQSLSAIARSVGMSAFHFQRIFRRLVGMTPHQYLIRRRLIHSCLLLRQGTTVTDAALYSGFNNLSHFTRMFKKRFGICPTDYPESSAMAVSSWIIHQANRAGAMGKLGSSAGKYHRQLGGRK